MPNDCLEKLREVKKLREEIIEKGLTPYLKIDVAEDVILPEHLKNQKEMILNISSSATELLVFSDDKVSFSCQFLGVEFEVTIPGQRILSCYEKETGIGQSWKDKSLEFEKAFAAFSKRTEESDFGTALTAYKTVLTTENDGLENSLQSADRAKRRLSVLGLWAPFLVKNKCYAEAVEICSDAFALLGDTWARPALPVESINPDAEAWLGLWASCLIHTGHYGKASDKYKLWFDLFYANRPDDEAKAKFLLEWLTLDINLRNFNNKKIMSVIITEDLIRNKGLYCNYLVRAQALIDLNEFNGHNSGLSFKDGCKELNQILLDTVNTLVDPAHQLYLESFIDVLTLSAEGKYELACNAVPALESESPHRFVDRCILVGVIERENNNLKSADRIFRNAWDCISKIKDPDFDLIKKLFYISIDWVFCVDAMEDTQAWVTEVSSELCRSLIAQNQGNPPSSLGELHGYFARFHLCAMFVCIFTGHPERLVDILSRVSSWRMATALLDELETINPAAEDDEDSRTLQHYQRLRLEVRRLQQRLQEKEVADGRSGTDFTGLRNFGLDIPKRSGEAQARLDAEINALRAEYDQTYTQMQQAQAKAALVPGYAALSIDRSVLDSQKIQQSLGAKQALLIVFDQTSHGDKPEDAQQLSGALLLKGDSVYWHPLNDIAQGSAFLHEFEYFVGTSRGDVRGSESDLDDDERDMASSAAEPIVYGDFRRGDAPQAAADQKHEPSIYQGSTITHDNLWPSLGHWVASALWQPLMQMGLLDGVEELVLVTQGQQAHSIPWQMGAPVQSTAIRRYPGLMFYAMDAGLMSRATCSEEPTLGIAHYQGNERPLPFARIEADILGQIWVQTGHKAVQDFDYLNPQQSAGCMHVAGHGSHAPNPNQAATACLSVGENTRWGLAQLMSSPGRPKQVYLSCCVAGRTTDLGGEQYGITAALLQHGTREVVASSVSLSDLWGSTLSIATHSLMQQHKLSMKAALNQAQAMVTGEMSWDETAWEWVTKGWEMRLAEMRPLASVLHEHLPRLLGLLQLEKPKMRSDQALATEFRRRLPLDVHAHIPHLTLLQFDSAKQAEWAMALALELRTHNGLADEATLATMVKKHADTFRQTLMWPTRAPALIAGSLAFATTVLG